MLAFVAKAVPIFAVLSGFLVYLSARNIRDNEGTLKFMRRRLFRIVPVYLFSLLLLLMLSRYETLGYDVAIFPLFVSEAFFFHALSFPTFVNPVAWSLYVELLFYFVLPVYVACVSEKYRLQAAILTLIILLIHASVVVARVFDLWPYFFFGIVAAEVCLSKRLSLSPTAAAWVFAAGAVLVAVDLQGPEFDPFSRLALLPRDDTGTTIGLGLGMLLILVGIYHAKKIAAALDLLPLRILGAISYSVFLMHPIYLIVNFTDLRFAMIGQQHELWQTIPAMPGWYLPFVFFPGILLWAGVTWAG